MQQDALKVIGDAVDQTLDSGPDDLYGLAERLAVWAVRNTVNDDGSRLREKGLTLAGAIYDWAKELYPNS